MDTRIPTPPAAKTVTPAPQKSEQERDLELDREVDRELDDTFPASDPLPWSHEVK